MADTRTYIKVHDGMPDHPKVDGLSDRAFRLLVESWCWCSRHLTDGKMPAATWRKRGTPKARKELIAAGLVRETADGVDMHDYLQHQRSAEEVQQIRDAKGKGGALGNHIRWHVSRGVVDPDCAHCEPPNRFANGSHMRSQDRSQNDRKTSPVSVSETEVQGSVGESSSVVDARAKFDDRDSKIDKQIIELLRALTGRTVGPEWARQVRLQILSGRRANNPSAYVAKAIRSAPRNYLPGDGDPSSRSVAEAIAAARGEA